ncbi:MAG: hypothetical protein DMD86_18360 [Candidatus Rokuibacteriota bacterium]|nr:MAG: hypothetical protein DMD86_18360 [Candidatus Rokubacteria bacterium]
MAGPYTAEFWAHLLEIGFLNLLLSGDNAVVIALAVRTLPWRQRLLGQIWGTVGAVVLRLLFVGIVSALLRIPFLRLAGASTTCWPSRERREGTCCWWGWASSPRCPSWCGAAACWRGS